MAGSLWKIYPWKECLLEDTDRHGDLRCLAEQNVAPDDKFLLAMGLMIAGFLLVNLLDHMQSKDNPIFRYIWKLS